MLEEKGLALTRLTKLDHCLVKSVINRLRLAKSDKINLNNSKIGKGNLVELCFEVRNQSLLEEEMDFNVVTKENRIFVLLPAIVLLLKEDFIDVAVYTTFETLELLLGSSARHINLRRCNSTASIDRMKARIASLATLAEKNYLISLLFGGSALMEPLGQLKPYQRRCLKSESFVWFNESLNSAQKDAVKFALHQQHFAVIHGPPGTGKTTTLAEVILQLITRGSKVLVCAHSNTAVDNIFSGLLKATKKMEEKFSSNFRYVRAGNPAKIDQDILHYSLDYLLKQHGTYRALLEDYENAKRCGSKSVRKLREKLKKQRKRFEERILRSANVTMATLVGSFKLQALPNTEKQLRRQHHPFLWDVVLIDECAQAIEPATWIPLVYAKKCILAGDHHQLPMTIQSKQAQEGGLGESLMERIVQLFEDEPERTIRMLTVQYRMHHLIMEWPSEYFYQNKLIADPSVASHRLRCAKTKQLLPVIRLIDTVDCDMYEIHNSVRSTGNNFEAEIVFLYIQSLLSSGVKTSDIGKFRILKI